MTAPGADDSVGTSRRDAVLESALLTFARHGYRKTSMEEVARVAQISRPGLYFLFASKDALFRAAVTRALQQDLAAAEEVLADTDTPLPERLVGAFDRWAGRYIGPTSRDVPMVIEQNPDLLGPITETAPRRFEQLVAAAVAEGAAHVRAVDVAQTLISASAGLKYQVQTREAYLARLHTAVGLLIS